MISVPYLVDLDATCLAGQGQRHLHRDGWGSEGLVDVAGKTPPKWRDEDPFQNYFDAKQATRGSKTHSVRTSPKVLDQQRGLVRAQPFFAIGRICSLMELH